MNESANSTLPAPEATCLEVLEHLESGKCSTEDLIGRYLQFLETTGRDLGAAVEVFHESALEAARKSDARREAGSSLGLLEGVPFTAKMNIATDEGTTDASSAILKGFVAGEDATAVARLRSEGAILVGKSNCDEFAMGASNETSHHGIVRNPWDIERVPGGSSGGAAALAGSFGWAFHLGSDTGGSIRQPAAFCGATGMKPTWGRVSRRGLVAFGSSLDQIGPLTRDAKSAQRVLRVMEGKDPLDATTAESLQAETGPVKRIGLVSEGLADGVDPEIRQRTLEVADQLRSLGFEVVEVSLPTMSKANACYQVIATAEASSNLARYDGVHVGARISADDLQDLYCKSRREGFGEEVRRRILLGTFVLSSGYIDAYYGKAQKVRGDIRDEILNTLESVDALLMPVSPFAPFRIGERVSDPLALYACDILTVTANLAGVPAVAVPCGSDSEGLPLGLQWLGKPGEDHRLLDLAASWQETDESWRQLPSRRKS
ncbi:glutaminyl-tRNA synthase (glutamine-hydrolyzing) subunit A [bacterium TMED181]|nr:Asp-tRNA(Asn)/Glu-tRNA(Gln) amidotransferase GatCAB subunit A [Planctomycetota bacterium]OUW46217.1 MAG: glutaminyl-tRNA synthase (glutamine-hydrolyzing) subunit A [bacterium TMED181]